MLSDAAPNASISVPSSNRKDFVKKKRANRLSKLKQCKLDARREQWLSQVRNKGGSNGTIASQGPPIHVMKERGRALEKLDMIPINQEKDASSMNNYSDSESFASNSPASHGSSVFSNYDSSVNFNASTSSGRSSTSSEMDPVILSTQYITDVASISISNGSSSCRSSSCNSSVLCTGNTSGEDEVDDDDDFLDDWEARADALAIASSEKEKTNAHKHDVSSESIVDKVDGSYRPSSDPNENDITGKTGNQKGLENRHAWKLDDAFRPQSLPNLSKQYSSTMASEFHKNVSTVATSCPICFEDFDYMDSSFLPCPCGFRICLFCHKRVVEEDGRCPGCRKKYERT